MVHSSFLEEGLLVSEGGTVCSLEHLTSVRGDNGPVHLKESSFHARRWVLFLSWLFKLGVNVRMSMGVGGDGLPISVNE
jgi:hypothetical protein